jgi:hypothetical protein
MPPIPVRHQIVCKHAFELWDSKQCILSRGIAAAEGNAVWTGVYVRLDEHK